MSKLKKLGILSDVHNDVEGLKKALDVLNDCDKVVHLGDMVEDSDKANLIIEILIKNLVEGVIGYHDELALSISSNFTSQGRDYLTSLPKEIARGDFRLVHDNPLSKEKNEGLVNSGGYIKDEYAASKVFDEAEFKVLLVGHTHRAEQYSFDGYEATKHRDEMIQLDPGKRYILNPGPVCEQQRGTVPSVGVFDFTSNQFLVRRIWGEV